MGSGDRVITNARLRKQGPVPGRRPRARGIDGIRVADASIRPEIVSGDTNAPSVMVGATAADLVSAGRRLPLGE